MITSKTVLILGAGASVPFGYPLGRDLWKEICDRLADPHSKLSSLIQSLGTRVDEIAEFRNSLLEAQRPTVDTFLERRPSFNRIGKLAIAYCLVTKEDPARLFTPQAHWYQHLWAGLDPGPSIDDFLKNQLAMCTFNYDRSLEHFLFTALHRAYGVSGTIVGQVLNSFPIIHLYGHMGSLPWQKEGGRPYGPVDDASAFQEASANIQIIPEDRAGADSFARAFQLMNDAERIYFLGFGYDKTNMERLNVQHIPMGAHKKVIRGTAVQLTELERSTVSALSGGRIELTQCTDTLGFLRAQVVW